MYLCMTEDAAKTALMQGAKSTKKDELDARNSGLGPSSFEEVVATLYNDRNLNLSTEALPDVDSMFAEPIDLPFASMPGGAITAEIVKTKLADARAKLVQVRLSMPASLVR